MNYLILNNKNIKLCNFDLGIASKKDIIEIEKITNLNYLLFCTGNIIKIEDKLEITDRIYKSLEDIEFQYKGKNKILLKGTHLDLCYIDYLLLDKNKFMALKIMPDNYKSISNDKDFESISIKKESEEQKKRGRKKK